MNNRFDGKAEDFITGLQKKARSHDHPLLEHPVFDAGEYVQKLYIDTLCVVAQYANENTTKGLSFVERLHSGSGLNDDFSEHIKNAMNITVEKFGDFFVQCRENSLEHIFMLDCLLIAGSDGVPNFKQIGFNVEIAEALELTKEYISLISQFAVVILEQDKEKYYDLCEKMPIDCVMNIVVKAMCYVKEFVSGVLIDNADMLWICVKESEFYDFDKSDYKYIKGYKKIIFENISTTSNLIIKNCGRLILKKCFFYNRINFLNIGLVNIEDSQFDMQNKEEFYYIFWLEDVGTVFIDNCKISNVSFERRNGSGVFKVESCLKLIVNRSFFFNIHKRAYFTILASGAYDAAMIVVRNCRFESCLQYNLFPSSRNLTLEKNEISNCCDIY